MTRCQAAAPLFIPASSTTAVSPTPASTCRTALRSGPTSALRMRFPDHFFQDPGIGEVAEEDNLALPDAEDLDGRRRDRLTRCGQGDQRAHLHDHHLRVLGLVELCHLEV